MQLTPSRYWQVRIFESRMQAKVIVGDGDPERPRPKNYRAFKEEDSGGHKIKHSGIQVWQQTEQTQRLATLKDPLIAIKQSPRNRHPDRGCGGCTTNKKKTVLLPILLPNMR